MLSTDRRSSTRLVWASRSPISRRLMGVWSDAGRAKRVSGSRPWTGRRCGCYASEAPAEYEPIAATAARPRQSAALHSNRSVDTSRGWRRDRARPEGGCMIDYCLNQDPHFGHTFVREELRGDALARVEVECPGIGTQHCSRVDGHEEHLFEEDGSRYLCEGTEVEPGPAPE